MKKKKIHNLGEDFKSIELKFALEGTRNQILNREQTSIPVQNSSNEIDVLIFYCFQLRIIL